MRLQNRDHLRVRPHRNARNFCRSVALATAAVTALAATALAGPRYWDANGGTGGPGNTGGSGTWTNSSQTWRDGSINGSLTTWSNEQAHFGDVGGTVIHDFDSSTPFFIKGSSFT